MAAMPHNIEKSAFRRGEYVGYGAGYVWRIRRTNSSFGNWVAVAHHGGGGERVMDMPTPYAFRLAELGEKIAAAKSAGRAA